MKQVGTFVRSLHGIRGIAVLYVLLSHIGIGGFYLVPFVPLERIGKIGVIMFFSLSAFLLTAKLSVELRTNTPRWRTISVYFTHRFFRIYPLLIVALTMHVLAGNFGVYDFFQHLLLRQGYFELWAIPVEFKYYFCIPIIALVAAVWGAPRALILVCAGLLFATAYGLTYPETQLNNDIALHEKLEPFLVGSLLALLVNQESFSSSRIGRCFSSDMCGLVAVTLLAISTYLFREIKPQHLHGFWLPAILLLVVAGTSGLIITALQDNRLSRLLGSSPLVFFGEISFSIYLLHGFVLGYVWRHASTWRYTGAWSIVMVTVALSWLSYRLVERPGIRLGYRIGRWITGDASEKESRA